MSYPANKLSVKRIEGSGEALVNAINAWLTSNPQLEIHEVHFVDGGANILRSIPE